ncbi:hypothetical protein, partial [Salmonella sp. SAL4436]|uniref:hypothetical protein n=1 Tax=Salmonella sp. SAL4436 TaxID=3159891 RepID=UPI00397AFE97
RGISSALRNLGGAAAIRRSPLDDPNEFAEAPITRGGKPERETYLHLADIAGVIEAVRRIWGGGLALSSPAPVAIIVQRFIAPE